MTFKPGVKMGAVIAVMLCLVSASCLVFLYGWEADESSGPLTSTIFDVYEQDGLTHFDFESDYMFDKYLEKGSVYSQGLEGYLADNITSGKTIHIDKSRFCSAFMVGKDSGDGFFTGRNFDYYYLEPAVVHTFPEGGYSSVSIVDLSMAGKIGEDVSDRAGNTAYNALPFIPMDGVNEKGVFVCVNVVSSAEPINENESGKIPIFITTAIRLILDNASTTQEAVDLVTGYNLNVENNCHLFVCDKSGDSRAIEVFDNRTVVTPTRIMTNHYITGEGRDVPITGTSGERFDIIETALESKPTMSEEDVKETLMSVRMPSTEKTSTRWSVVYDLNACTGVVWVVSPQSEDGSMDYETPHRISI